MSNLLEKEEILNEDVEESLINDDKFQLNAKFNNDLIRIWLENNESIIIDVKKCIEIQTGLSVDKQILLFDGIILEDDRRLNDYQINNNSIIDIVSKLRIFVETVNKNIFAFIVDKFDKVSKFKFQIARVFNIDYDLQQLFYNDEELDDNKTLNDYKINYSMAVINIQKIIKNKIKLSIETIDENKISINVNNYDKIIDLKQKIGKLIEIVPEQQKLYYENIQLNDDEKRLMDYQISDKSIITAVDKYTMKIFIEMKDGENFSIFIKKSNKISEIKNKIKRKTKIDQCFQYLSYRDREMIDYETIDKFAINDEYAIQLIDARNSYFIKIIIKMFDETIFPIFVTKKMRIDDLNNQISAIKQLKYLAFILIYENEILDNKKSIDQYGICDQSEIYADIDDYDLDLKLSDFYYSSMDIFIRKPDKELFKLHIDSKIPTPIKEIKNQIEKNTGLNRYEYELIYKNEIMSISNDSMQTLASENKLTEKISFDEKSMETSQLHFHDDKCRILDMDDKYLSDYQIINLSVINIDDDKYLSDYQINNRSVINIDLKLGVIQIYIKSDETKFPIYLRQSDKIRDLKDKIKLKKHFNFHELILIYQGGILDDDNKTIDEYRISNQSIINIDYELLRSRGDILQIFVRKPDEKIFNLFVNKISQIYDITNQIKKETELNRNQYKLIYKNEIMSISNDPMQTLASENILTEKILIDEKSMKKYSLQSHFHDDKYKILIDDDYKYLSDYQICDRSIIHIVLNPGLIQISIKLPDETTFSLYFRESEKIREILMKIIKEKFINLSKPILIYHDEILKNYDKTIDEYKICDQSVINIVEQFKVYFNFKNKKHLIENIQRSDKIIDIKYKIQDKMGLDPNLQQLIYQGEILDDDKMIGQYGIINRYSTIDILIKGGINIFVKTINGDVNEITIHKTQKIKYILKAINVKEQILIYQDKILEKENTINEYGISNKSIIWAVECRKDMQIIVIIIEELSVVFYVDKVNNIHQIRKKIEKKIGKKLDKYDLQYKDVILNENGECLMKYEIDESVIFIKALPRMKIFVKTKIGRTILMKLKRDGKVKDIKYYIQEQIGLHFTEQKLIYQDKILDDDNKSIIDHNICENSLIRIYDKNEIQIFVRTADGKYFALQMRKTEKIIDLKKKIFEKLGIRPNEQTLIYQGELLDDEKILNDYEINDESVINVVIKISGGVNVAIKVHDVFAFNINVQNNEIIGEVKRRIGAEMDLPADDLKLNCQSFILDDNNTLGNYQVFNGSEIVIDVQFRDEINIIITTMDKSKFQMKYLKQSHKISDLKLRIEERIKIHPEMQKLIYNKTVLTDDDKSIIDYQILDYSVINIEIENKILCDMNDKMSHIRTKIENRIQLDSEHRVLVFERKLLEDDKLFIYFQIRNRQEVIIDENFKYFKNAIKFNQLEDVKIHFVNDYLHMKYGSYLNNPIHYACKYASKEIINFLIEKRCDLEITQWENRTPLHLACIHGNIEAVQILIDKECNINPMDYLKRRPIHLACENKHKDIVDLLIKNKCEIEIRDYLDRCPLDIAKESKMDDIINIIYARKVADVMRLSCNDGCNHKFCFKSIVSNQFKGTLIYEEGLVKIYLCEESITDSRKKFAYKKFDKKRISKCIEGKINDFVKIIRNDRIIEYFGGFEIKRNKFVFMEFIETGSLQKQIGKSNLPLMKIIKQLLDALEFLHSKEIIHRDIKPDNILLDGSGNIKLIDFEFSCELSIVKEETSLDARFCGTLHYMAPEIMNDEMYSCSVDIWSLGVTVVEMATGTKPYNSLKQCDFIDKILTTRKIIYELPISLQDSENVKLLIDQMLISDGSKRVGAHELINKFYTLFPNYLHK